ncbi:MAG: hypothetical protein JWO31_1469 [Phycisphaerales bacterium]|nr:hypothetical protein [Phycisphaerales bacterium]
MPFVPNPRDFAFVVGIEHYPPGIPPLRGSINDAKFFSTWLADPKGGGLDPNNITTICSTVAPPPFPPKDDIVDRINTFFERRTALTDRLGRRLYLYFSGHGITPPTPNDDDCAIVAANVAPMGQLRCIPGRLAARTLQRGDLFEEIVLIMDCCREVVGTVDANLLLPPGNPTLQRFPAHWHGLAARWSSTAAEQQLPHPLNPAVPLLWQGVFTHAVLKGLTSGVNEAGRVTSESLKKFVRKWVQDHLDPANNQPPEIIYDDTLPLIDFGAGRFTEGTVRLRDDAAGFRVVDGLDLKPMAPAVLKKQPGEYVVRLPYGLYLFETPANGAPAATSQTVKVIGEPFNVQL